MSINIKQADGLKRLSQTIEFYKSNSNISIPQLFTGSYNDLTDKPIVDGTATIESIETEQASFYVQDGNGNTIALIDSQGVHSIDFIANGTSVAEHMDSSIDQLNNLTSSLDTHKANSTIHITSTEREKWNDPLSDDGDALYINDPYGQTIAVFDANGLTTTKVRIMIFDPETGEAKGDIDVAESIVAIEENINSIININNNQNDKITTLETATKKLESIEATDNDTTLTIIDKFGAPIAQFDENGLTVAEVTIAAPNEAQNLDGTAVSSYQVGTTLDAAIKAINAVEKVAADNQGAITDINNELTPLTERVSAVEGEIDTLQSQTSTLIASDGGKSVRTIANEELAAALIPSDAQESLNTLQEIADWIQDHPEDAAAMNSKIEANTAAINNHINEVEPRFNALEEKTANIEDSAESDAFTIYDKNNQPGFQVDASGTTVSSLRAESVNAPTITTGSISDVGTAISELQIDVDGLEDDLSTLSTNKQDALVNGTNTTIDGNKVNVSSFPYGSLTEVPTISGTTTVNVGGIPAGTTFTNKTLESVLSDIFFPYVAPSGLSISSTPSASTVVENGTTRTITSIKATYSAGSQPISSATLYKNGVVFTATPNQLTSPVIFNISDTIDASATYEVEITDDTTTLNKSLNVFTFVDPYFYGVTSNAAPTDEEILGSTKDIKTKGTKTYTFKPSNQRPFIAYPASYGALSLISDSANFDWTADFEGPVTMNLVLTNQVQATQYYVYYQKSAWTDTAGFSFTFKY